MRAIATLTTKLGVTLNVFEFNVCLDDCKDIPLTVSHVIGGLNFEIGRALQQPVCEDWQTITLTLER